VKKSGRQGKSDSIYGEEQGVLVGYDDDQGPLLARIYFSDTKIFELRDDGHIQYQSFKDQITGVDEPKEEPRERSPCGVLCTVAWHSALRPKEWTNLSNGRHKSNS
jgi:hypothetical protein